MWVKTEYIWAGSFAICASVVISVVGAGLLGVSQMQAKWQVKLATVLQSNSEGNRAGRFKRWSARSMLCSCFRSLPSLREG
jgi:high-affinity iron transporter